MNRRTLLTGLGAFLAAPAIVRASNIMPIKALANPDYGVVEVFNFNTGWSVYTCAELIDEGKKFYIGSDGFARLVTTKGPEPQAGVTLIHYRESNWAPAQLSDIRFT